MPSGKLLRVQLLGAACAVLCGTGPVDARPLKAELDQLLANHPQIREAKNLMDAAGHEVDRAFAPYLPSLNLTTNKGFEYVDNPARRDADQEPSSLSNEQATLELTYNLFDGFRKDAGYRIAETNETIAALNLENTRQSIMFVGVRTYWQLRLALRQLEIDRLAERAAREQLDGILETEGTQSTEIDTIRAKGRFYAARSARITSENQVTDLKAEYLRVFGHDPTPATMEDLPNISGQLPGSLEEALDIALSENPGFKSSRREIVLADETVRQAEASYFPSLSIVGTANWESNLDATRGIARDLNVVLRGTWQIYDGFATASGVKSASAQRAAAKNRNRFTYRQVVQDVTRVWNQIELNQNQVEVWEDSVENAEAAIKGLNSLVEQGRETRIAVLDGQIEVFNTKRQLNQFIGLKELAQYRLMLILGWLTPDIFDSATGPTISPLMRLQSDFFGDSEKTIPEEADAPDHEPEESNDPFRGPGSKLPEPDQNIAKADQSSRRDGDGDNNRLPVESKKTGDGTVSPLSKSYFSVGPAEEIFTNDVTFD